MTVFKAFFQAARRNLWPVILYIGIMLVMSVMITFSMGEKPDDLVVSTQDYRLAVYNHDAEDPVTRGLISFVGDRARLVDIGEGERAMTDALFWRDVDYVLDIPQGFGQSLLAGQPMQLKTYASPNDYTHMYVDAYVNRYLSTLRLYRERIPREDLAQSIARVEGDLKQEIPIVQAKQAKEDTNTTMAWYFRYISYPLLAAITSGVGMVMAALLKRNLVLRTRVSSLSETRRNGQMVLAALTYSSVIWVVLVVVGAITSRLSPAHVLTPRFGLMLLGSFLYMLISMSIALLACAITQKQNVITGVTNVVALGSSFLGGVFVPVEVLGESVVRIGKVLPAYWYTTAVRAVGDAGELGTAPLHAYWQGMGIMTLMLGVLLGATLLVNKIRRQRGI